MMKKKKMESWEKETRERLERLGYKFDGPSTLSKNDAVGIVIKMKSKLGRYTADNRCLAEREIEYLTSVHSITYGDIWNFKRAEKETTMKKFIRRPKDPFVARIIMSFVTGEFYCKICKKYYQSRSGIVGHIIKVHSKEIEEKIYQLTCENCGTEFESTNPKRKSHSRSCSAYAIWRKRMEKRDGTYREEKEAR